MPGEKYWIREGVAGSKSRFPIQLQAWAGEVNDVVGRGNMDGKWSNQCQTNTIIRHSVRPFLARTSPLVPRSFHQLRQTLPALFTLFSSFSGRDRLSFDGTAVAIWTLTLLTCSFANWVWCPDRSEPSLGALPGRVWQTHASALIGVTRKYVVRNALRTSVRDPDNAYKVLNVRSVFQTSLTDSDSDWGNRWALTDGLRLQRFLKWHRSMSYEMRFGKVCL